MQGGDIDNSGPGRMMVHLDVIVIRRPELTKVLGVIPVTREKSYYDRVAMNRFWLFTSRHAVSLEVFDYGCTQYDMDRVMEDLDRIGTNPFRWATAYRNSNELVDELAYRPEVVGVMDVPERAFFYGSKYFDMGRL